MARTGRPSKLTREIIDKVCKLIAAGNYDVVAAGAVGVHRATLIAWKNKGEKSTSGIYHDFYNAIKKASSLSEAKMVAIIQANAKDTWQAAAWYLERKHPDRWGRRGTSEIPADEKDHTDILNALGVAGQAAWVNYDKGQNDNAEAVTEDEDAE